MHLSSIEQHLHYIFSDSVEPVITIESSDRIVVETRDASNRQIRPGQSIPVDRTRLLPATGPIAIRNSRPGNAISVKIDSIQLGKAGYAWIRPGLGIRNIDTDGPYYVKRIDVSEAGAHLNDRHVIPLRPMVGIVGVGTPSETPTRFPGIHGGNLDCVDITEGNTLWLPVLIPGTLLSLGDVHAAMGEGEVSGTGVEIEAEVTIIVTLHTNIHLDGPIVITPKKTVFLASDPDPLQAARLALDRAIQALISHNGMQHKDAYITASVAGNSRICQLVNGDVTISHELPKEVLSWEKPLSFR
jgi:amidase